MTGLRRCGHPLGPSAHCSECAWEEYRKGPPLATLHDRGKETSCEHMVRWPHPCDDCDRRDIPPGKFIHEHPCYRQSGELSHRAIVRDGPIYCERCATELDQEGKHKSGAPLSWEPRAPMTFAHSKNRSVDDISDADLLERAVRGARGHAGRTNPRWVGIADSFALGRTYSRQLARRYGLDPDEKVRR